MIEDAWSLPALAADARSAADRFRSMGSNGARRAAYCRGVADVLLYLSGDLSFADAPAELSAILRAYMAGPGRVDGGEAPSDDPYCAEHGRRFDPAIGCPACRES